MLGKLPRFIRQARVAIEGRRRVDAGHLVVTTAIDIAAHFFAIWHSRRMKALKSQLASELLADPKARDQLRRFMIAKRSGLAASQQRSVNDAARIPRPSGGAVTAVLVPKAKTA